MSARRSASRRASPPDPGMRVSDAERAEVADRLSRHYGDGRLDQAEFNGRLDQAMSAKTHADLSGLFADLPAIEESEAVAGQRPERQRPTPMAARQGPGRPRNRIPFLVLVVVIAVVVGQTLVRSLFFWPFGGGPDVLWWLLIALLALLWLRRGPWQRRRR
jgi:hypothetical protein